MRNHYSEKLTMTIFPIYLIKDSAIRLIISMWLIFQIRYHIDTRYGPRNCKTSLPAVIGWISLAHKWSPLIGWTAKIITADLRHFLNSSKMHISNLDDTFCGCVICQLQNRTFCSGEKDFISFFLFMHDKILFIQQIKWT